MNDQKPTFKQAMEATMIWCQSWENDEIPDEVLKGNVDAGLLIHEGFEKVLNLRGGMLGWRNEVDPDSPAY